MLDVIFIINLFVSPFPIPPFSFVTKRWNKNMFAYFQQLPAAVSNSIINQFNCSLMQNLYKRNFLT